MLVLLALPVRVSGISMTSASLSYKLRCRRRADLRRQGSWCQLAHTIFLLPSVLFFTRVWARFWFSSFSSRPLDCRRREIAASSSSICTSIFSLGARRLNSALRVVTMMLPYATLGIKDTKRILGSSALSYISSQSSFNWLNRVRTLDIEASWMPESSPMLVKLWLILSSELASIIYCFENLKTVQVQEGVDQVV